ncbi:MAG: BsuBI/PstI family type II restriction endonuclease [bacterium]
MIGEAVTSAGVVDGKRRRELKDLFSGFRSGLVFVTVFETRDVMGRFLSQISWETEVWIAEDPDHVVHFDGERFLGPYPDTIQSSDSKEGAS